MNQHPYYNPEHHGDYALINIGDLDLACGQTLHDCTLAVATHGRLNARKDNAVLIPTWYSGTSKIIEDVFIGPGRAIDPDKYFVIVVNQIGNGLSSSPHHRAGSAAFPAIGIADDVSAQHRYITQHLGLTTLALVMGGSMGAQQSFEWAVRYPDMVQRMAAIAGTARTSGINQMLADAIIDGLRSGDASADLSQHARLMTLYGLSADFFEQQHFKPLGFDSVEAFVNGFMKPYFLPMDPGNLTTMLQKWRAADVSHLAGGNLREALGRITAKALIMPIAQDMIFPPSTSREDAEMIKGAVFHASSSPAGHLALFGIDGDWVREVDGQLTELLGRG
ncbi:alpha/beta fold hydrolase [Pseudomonas capeferrum]|uniref:alpha/beta fold hydrolase n=1 Tax=Pseudomonas capeferrum TaxID=1495066 RepID=UPI0015E43316|nr:alpha/beta fold hydrolase [Pseudomonas capeferrum]MBA1203309.1 alpha/beta fold hydrolase [Pseudomonas capeferrum]